MKKIYNLIIFSFLVIFISCSDNSVTPAPSSNVVYEKDSLILYDNDTLPDYLYVVFNLENISSFKALFESQSTITDTLCGFKIDITIKNNDNGSTVFHWFENLPENKQWEVEGSISAARTNVKFELLLQRFGGNSNPLEYLMAKNIKFYKLS